jgi:hypothetical protein
MLPEGFEPTVSADERLQTYALDRTSTEIGAERVYYYVNITETPWDPRIEMSFALQFTAGVKRVNCSI